MLVESLPAFLPAWTIYLFYSEIISSEILHFLLLHTPSEYEIEYIYCLIREFPGACPPTV